MRTCPLLLLPALLASVFACTKPEPVVVEPEPKEDTYEATITLATENTVTLGAEEGAKGTLVFSCDHEWSLDIPEEASWLSASKLSGKSTKTTSITFTAKANEGARRSVTCRIVSGATKKKFTVAQDMAVLILSASDVPDLDKYYKPKEFNFDMLRSDAQWSWCRSKQS